MRALYVAVIVGSAALVGSDSVSVVAGTTKYENNAILTPSPAVPTVVYNCAKVPALCSNVASYMPMNTAQMTLSTDPAVFHFNKNEANHDRRRDQSCPGTWSNTHICPEEDQPAVVLGGSYVNLRGNLFAGAFEGKIFVDPGDPDALGARGHMIADDTTPNTYSGLIWSCDEFPAAR